jgi:hypothetical protein
MTEYALAVTKCALAMTACARSDGVRARNNRAFGQPTHFRYREAAGRGDLRPTSVIARPQAVAICDPLPSSRGLRPWRSVTHFRHREAAGRGDLRPTSVIARPQAVAIYRCRSSGVDCRASLAMTECALAMTKCALAVTGCALVTTGPSASRPTCVIARPQAVAICDPLPSSRGHRPWRSVTHLCHREAAGCGDL